MVRLGTKTIGLYCCLESITSIPTNSFPVHTFVFKPATLKHELQLTKRASPLENPLRHLSYRPLRNRRTMNSSLVLPVRSDRVTLIWSNFINLRDSPTHEAADARVIAPRSLMWLRARLLEFFCENAFKPSSSHRFVRSDV